MLAAAGVGMGSTGSLGLLVDAVVKRIVTAMVVWSQIGIAGYLLGPLVGGFVAEGLGYSAIGVVAACFGLAVLAALRGETGAAGSRFGDARAASGVVRIGPGISAAPAMTRQNATTRAPTSSGPEPSGSWKTRMPPTWRQGWPPRR